MQKLGFTLPTWIAVLTFVGCDSGQDVNSLTEDQLLQFASRPYDQELFRQPPIALGKLGGVEVVATHICSDICPGATVRVIHFELPRDASCASVGGAEKSIFVPEETGHATKTYCFPKILIENWGSYISGTAPADSEFAGPN
jgi:hypothetical protein